jgi:hypothetical protein
MFSPSSSVLAIACWEWGVGLDQGLDLGRR